MKQRWDIFCHVVDNFGDMGVTWRLARQLVAEHDCSVRLWVDDLAAFQRFCPIIDATQHTQSQAGVTLCRWSEPWRPTAVAEVVIEAFGCQLPAAYQQTMQKVRPYWLNLEYLSAESWVEGCHQFPSLQANGLQKFFYFPGFSIRTGGLLRERDLFAKRSSFQNSLGVQQYFLSALGVSPQQDERLYSLFAYPSAALADWLSALADDPAQTLLLVPETQLVKQVASWLGVAQLSVGNCYLRGQLRIQLLPFLSQADYDRLLWVCDFNVVRGEDSFIRALWAAKPLLWHPYPQADSADQTKLAAFLALYTADMSADSAQALAAFWYAWLHHGDIASAWRVLQVHQSVLALHAQSWAAAQSQQQDLAAGLVQFCATPVS